MKTFQLQIYVIFLTFSTFSFAHSNTSLETWGENSFLELDIYYLKSLRMINRYKENQYSAGQQNAHCSAGYFHWDQF